MCGTALTMSHFESVVATVQWVAVVVRIGLGLLAAWQWGIVGLGASAALTTFGMYGTLWWLTWRRMHMWTHPTFRPRLGLLRQTSS